MWLGIDPGRSKCGWALVDADGGLCLSGIIPREIPNEWVAGVSAPTEEICSRLRAWTTEAPAPPTEPIKSIIIGTGTGYKEVKSKLADCFDLEIKAVDEKHTTLAARCLYWKLHPPSGLWRLIPTSTRVPKRDIDDLAAWAIVLQMIEKGEK